MSIVETAIERKQIHGDINLIWVQLGIYSDEAKAKTEENGINYVQNKCLYVEYLA